MPVEYIGEHAIWSNLGHIAVIITLGAALFAGLCYFFSTFNKETAPKYRIYAKFFLILHTLGILSIVGILFFLLTSHYFEFDYVWKHSNTEMPMRYILSCFWEGQEGSFLLWIFWNMVLMWFVRWKAKDWESHVMTVFLVIQVFLTTMLLGIYIGDYKVGSDPFGLIREAVENHGLPWTFMADYLQKIPTFADGRGLNPLLQNYWMTIHPPTLFLGFASTTVPFAYAIAGLWRKQLKEWITPALPWTYFGIAILGTGILMGGAWAYEALSFGGFWAWDPVENAVLVPWIVLVAAAHVMLISRKTGNALFTSAFLAILTFLLILYSTYLTRSGILGDTSVHSFTSDGMEGQLLWGMLLLIWASLALLIQNRKLILWFTIVSVLCIGVEVLCIQMGLAIHWPAVVLFILAAIVFNIVGAINFWPKPNGEESLTSREFWMFIGSLVLVLSAIHITVITSVPVGAALFDADWTTTVDPDLRIEKFHKFQIPFAIVIGLLLAITQFWKYRKTKGSDFVKKLALPFGISVVLSIGFTFLLGFGYTDLFYILLLFTCIFAIISNGTYWLKLLKGRLNFAGASIAHIGFAMILLGALISTGTREKISSSTYNVSELIEGIDENESALLIKGDTIPMGPYYVSFRDHHKEGVNIYFHVDYFTAIPHQYKAGDLVFHGQNILEARMDHEGTEKIEQSIDNWKIVELPTAELMAKSEPYQQDCGDFEFTLSPILQTNERFGNVAEPATRHYLFHDIYTHIQFVNGDVIEKPDGDYRESQEHKGTVGDTLFPSNHMVVLDSKQLATNPDSLGYDTSDIIVQVNMTILDGEMDAKPAQAYYVFDKNLTAIEHTTTLADSALQITITDIDIDNDEFTFSISEHRSLRKDFIVMQAIRFPFINILWLGCLIMVLGSAMAIAHRIRENRRLAAKA